MGKELGKRALEKMNRVYAAGTRVEAVWVRGVDVGAKGTVKSVRKTGDIDVDFDRFGVMTVNHLSEIIRPTDKTPRCMLMMKREGEGAECKDDCSMCGWNPRVDSDRKAEIYHGGMAKRDGLMRLVLKSN